MAMNYNGILNEDGYYEQARIVSRHIDELHADNVLELASGKGFNSVFLARQYPHVRFRGIDITPSHVSQAQSRATGLTNLSFEIGNFQALSFGTQTLICCSRSRDLPCFRYEDGFVRSVSSSQTRWSFRCNRWISESKIRRFGTRSKKCSETCRGVYGSRESLDD